MKRCIVLVSLLLNAALFFAGCALFHPRPVHEVRVEIRNNGCILDDGTTVAPANLASCLRERKRGTARQIMVLSSASDTSYDAYFSVLAAAGEAGYIVAIEEEKMQNKIRISPDPTAGSGHD